MPFLSPSNEANPAGQNKKEKPSMVDQVVPRTFRTYVHFLKSQVIHYTCHFPAACPPVKHPHSQPRSLPDVAKNGVHRIPLDANPAWHWSI